MKRVENRKLSSGIFVGKQSLAFHCQGLNMLHDSTCKRSNKSYTHNTQTYNWVVQVWVMKQSSDSVLLFISAVLSSPFPFSYMQIHQICKLICLVFSHHRNYTTVPRTICWKLFHLGVFAPKE